jgi:oligosaccharide repeat unit polymerase
MSDSPMMPNAGFKPDGSPAVVAGVWPLWTGARARNVVDGAFKPRRELPVYCSPIALFFAVWILMLACLSVHVSYVIYPGVVTPLLIFIVSGASLLLGYYASTAVLHRDAAESELTSFQLDITGLWRLNLLFCLLAVLIMAFNWIISGPPPAIGDPSTYLVYGNLKQILFPTLTCIAVNATLDTSRLRRLVFIAFAIGGIGLYVARGILLVTFLQMFFLFSIRSRMSRKKQYLLAIGALVIGIAAMTIIGNLRTAHDIFIEFLQIRGDFADWPMAFLWFVSYISIPFSNLCWMVAHGPSHGPTFAFLYSLLPSFMAPSDPYADVYGNMNIIDNASTYLQAWALDFSYLGIYLANLLIGLGCGWLVNRAYPKNILILIIFLTSISLMFFSDMLFLLSTVIEVLLQLLVLNKCFKWGQRESSHAYETA